jgi:hypothetical protein
MSVSTESVVAKANGHLMCEECNTYWCIHVEQAVRDNEDAFIIWEDYAQPQQLEIPIVPTSNLWATVVLTAPINPKSKIYKVEYSFDTISETHHLGYIHPSEGRNVIRSMVLDWFVGTQAPDVKECDAPGHGYKQTVRFNEDMKKSGTRIIQQWSIWATSKCLGCTFAIDDNKDLVPDVGPKTSPWDGSKTF